ncbi:MAG: carboxymuconolactone decarboxylase family protein [Solirubrobacteraceae bacterium]
MIHARVSMAYSTAWLRRSGARSTPSGNWLDFDAHAPAFSRCIDMHTKDARAIGETEHRLYSLPAWRATPYFTDRERAALAFTEAVTLLADDHVPDEAFEAVSSAFDVPEVAALLSLVVTINAWNAAGVSAHAWVSSTYER